MKKAITLLALLVATTSFSQIKKIENPERVEIGKITPGGIKTIYCEKINDEHYTIYYKDAKYVHLDEWKSFTINSDEDFNDLFDVIIDGFKESPEEPIMLETPNGYIWLEYQKLFGRPHIRFAFTASKSEYSNIGFSNQYNERQVRRLFGK